MNDWDRDYYERRRVAAIANADRARTPSIAKIHRQFAAHYSSLLAGEPASRETTA